MKTPENTSGLFCRHVFVGLSPSNPYKNTSICHVGADQVGGEDLPRNHTKVGGHRREVAHHTGEY
jgi:hypothetical protein